ncbi:hypothetical protein TKK_0007668 [Trichogramma kaykai]|uniref:WAPL domain-containing protein n=1 Tax=Trichogramma kaykai TaxID=54128 RepID=A0ABD2X8N5_9HYME
MSTKSYNKSLNRKGNNVGASGNIQFEKLFRENSNRPSVSKSAGIVGKWGITSFTSIRSSNINDKPAGESRKSHGTKRPKLDVPKSNSFKKKAQPPAPAPAPTKISDNKPKKFFKSRNQAAAAAAAGTLNVDKKSNPATTDVEMVSGNSHPKTKSDQAEEKNVLQSTSSENLKPPIVLRICKGTARLVGAKISKDSSSEEVSSPTSSSNNTTTNNRDEVTDHTTRKTRSRTKVQETDVNVHQAKFTISTETAYPKKLNLKRTYSDANEDYATNDVIHYPKLHIKEIPERPSKSEIEDNNSKSLLNDVPSYLPPALPQQVTNNERTESVVAPLNVDNLTSDQIVHTDEPDSLPVAPVEEKYPENVYQNQSDNKPTPPPIGEPKSNVVKEAEQDWFSDSDESEGANNANDAPNEAQEPSSVDGPSALLTSSSSSSSSSKTFEKPALLKKGSIFKTRCTGTSSSNKRRALYKHKWCDGDKESKALSQDNAAATDTMMMDSLTSMPPTKSGTLLPSGEQQSSDASSMSVMDFQESESSTTSYSDATSGSGKKTKEFYTVVKNVKKAHQIQESGEFQEFNDDVEYILDTLRENNPNATRCLSAIRLATKCMAPAFRMHVRAHGTVAKFFKALHDAKADQSLALCTATVMFVLSQDRLAMDLDRDCLSLMLSLLDSDASYKNALNDCGLSYAELLKNKERVRQLCADIQSQGHAKHLNIDNITVGQLAMETLLSLTSKRAGEWFKEELRKLGGLDFITKTITECYSFIFNKKVENDIWSEELLDKLRKVDRCLRVLENVTNMNEENQIYLLSYDNSILENTLASLYDLCIQEVKKYPTHNSSDKASSGVVIRECLIAIIKVFINLTHRFKEQSTRRRSIGFQYHIVRNSLMLLLNIPPYLPDDRRFDVRMLALIFLINLTEQSEENKKYIINCDESPSSQEQTYGVQALIDLFFNQEELARLEEKNTDAILDGKKEPDQSTPQSSASKSREDIIEETVAQLLQKAGRHMEHTLIAAYVALLLGYLIMDNDDYVQVVRSKLPDNKFSTMVLVLQKFFNFMNLTASNEVSSCGIAATEKVIKFMKMLDEVEHI